MNSTHPSNTDVETVWVLARDKARHFRHLYIRTEHLLLAMLQMPNSPAYDTLTTVGLDCARLSQADGQLSCPMYDGEIKLTPSSSIQRAFARTHPVNMRQLLRGILQQTGMGCRLLEQPGVELIPLEQLLEGKCDDAK